MNAERASMSKTMRLIAMIAAGCAGVAACMSQLSQATASATPQCIGLSICPPPPPDAEGNPGCYYADGWRANTSGDGIEVWYFHEPQNLSKPDKITVLVRKKDGTNESQDANIDAGQQTHRLEFPTIDESAVQEVLLNTSNGRCFVVGPGS
jgi:hypothetical protein